MPTIVELPELLDAVDPGARQMFDAALCVGELAVPPRLASKIARWYGKPGDDGPGPAIRRASSQRVVRTVNRFSLEGSQFNELRAKRPLPRPDTEKLTELIECSREGCDFCDPVNMSTVDTWGRIEGNYSVSAANGAKYDANHGMVVFGPHHPHEFDREHVRDYLDVAGRWLDRTHSNDETLKYPFIMWNCLGAAGASLVHGHCHMLISDFGHYGKQVALIQAAKAYASSTGREYWQDWIETHRQLGLAHECDGIHVAASITPAKEKEVVIVDARAGNGRARRFPDARFADALTLVLRTFIDKLGVLSFNVGIFLQPYDADGYEMPLVACCVDRGDPSPLPPGKAKTGDIGGMEFYGSPVVAFDPFRVAHVLGEAIGEAAT